MITASQIAAFRMRSDDYETTQLLKSELAQIQSERQPPFLTGVEYDKVLRWKLRQQYGRLEHLRKSNTEAIIRAVTRLALTIACPHDKEYELELRMNSLCCLRGVGVPVASAFLALAFPEEYAVNDYRAWRQVFGEDRRSFSLSDYKRYLDTIRPLADELGWPVQEVDLAIWEYDRWHSS